MDIVDEYIKRMKVEPLSKDFTERVMRWIRRRRRLKQWILVPVFLCPFIIGLTTGIILNEVNSNPDGDIIAEIIYEDS